MVIFLPLFTNFKRSQRNIDCETSWIFGFLKLNWMRGWYKTSRKHTGYEFMNLSVGDRNPVAVPPFNLLPQS